MIALTEISMCPFLRDSNIYAILNWFCTRERKREFLCVCMYYWTWWSSFVTILFVDWVNCWRIAISRSETRLCMVVKRFFFFFFHALQDVYMRSKSSTMTSHTHQGCSCHRWRLFYETCYFFGWIYNRLNYVFLWFYERAVIVSYNKFDSGFILNGNRFCTEIPEDYFLFTIYA